MVKIINGEIVQDDDPRAVEWEKRQREPWRANSSNTERPGSNRNQAANAGANPGNQSSPLRDVNSKLVTWGVPPFSVAGFTVQPIMSVSVLLVALIWGALPGVAVAVLWYVFGKDQF